MRRFFPEKFRHPRGGFTVIELILTIAVAAIIASAFINFFVPQFNLLMYMPDRLRVQNEAHRLMETLVEGDRLSPGLRYAGALAGATASIQSADATNITYTFITTNGESHTVTLVYDPLTGTFKKTVNSVTLEETLQESVQVGSFEKNIADEPAIFKYYDSASPPQEFIPTLATMNQIARVDIAIKVSPKPGSGAPSDAAVILKSGVEIKNLIQVGSAC